MLVLNPRTELKLKPIVPKSNFAKQSVKQPLEYVQVSDTINFKRVTICHIIINYFLVVAFIFPNTISQNALEEGLCPSRVGLAHPHPHARNVEYFRVGFHRPTFFTSLPARLLSLSADRAPAARFNLSGKSRKQLKFFGFILR